MPLQGRLLDVTLGDPYSNLALEEALFLSVKHPTLRVWENQRSVVIGRAQVAMYETDLDYCLAESIPIVRRMSAGGTVYNGPGNLNWSFFAPRGRSSFFPRIDDAKLVFASFAGLVADALRRSGIRSAFHPPNRIVVGSAKISGMAAYISRKATLCHGTLLIDADLEEVQRLTKPKRVRLSRRYPRSKFVPVTNSGVNRSKFVEALAASGPNFGPGELTQLEEKTCAGLMGKYSSAEWNLGDPFGRKDL